MNEYHWEADEASFVSITHKSRKQDLQMPVLSYKEAVVTVKFPQTQTYTSQLVLGQPSSE